MKSKYGVLAVVAASLLTMNAYASEWNAANFGQAQQTFQTRVAQDEQFRPASPESSEINEPSLFSNSLQSKAVQGVPTYTYLRCYYQKAPSQSDPAPTGYDWALTPNGDYYQINGYWHSLLLSAMFYTQTSQKELRDVCQYTLLRTGHAENGSLNFAAANSKLSLDYKIWTNDDPQKAGASAEQINRIITFGDSLSDDGNLFEFTQWILPNQHSWDHGRFGNGPVWPEYVSRSMNLPLYDFAIGGAFVAPFGIPNVASEITEWSKYKAYAANYEVKNTLFTFWIGANDLKKKNALPPSELAYNVEANLDRLIQDGAKNILVLNMPDIGLSPRYINTPDSATMTARVDKFNLDLSGVTRDLKSRYGDAINIQLFDVDKYYKLVHEHPQAYGITNVTQSCLDLPSASDPMGDFHWYGRRASCQNPDQFLSWDNLHPTTHIQKLLAGYITEFIQASYPVNKVA